MAWLQEMEGLMKGEQPQIERRNLGELAQVLSLTPIRYPDGNLSSIHTHQRSWEADDFL